jgi:phosphate transport system substrate-binding protein
MTRRPAIAAPPVLTRRRALLTLGASAFAAGIDIASTRAQSQNIIAPPGLGGGEETRILLTICGDDGSATTIIPKIATDFLQFHGASGIGGSEADPPWTTQITGTMLNGQKVAVLIRASSSTDGFSLLASGMADIALAIREPSPNELPSTGQPSSTNGARDVEAIALNAMVLIVNTAVGMSALSFDQARGIFAGKITDWSMVGGHPGPIHRYSRAIDYRSNPLFGAAMGNEAILPGLRVVSSYAAMRDSVAGDRQAIGYVPVNFIYQQRLSKWGDVHPVRFRLGDRMTAMPNEYGLATGDYPLVFPILLYRLPGHDNPEIDTFFATANSVQAHVIEMFAGLTSVTPRLLFPHFTEPLPPAYGDRVQNALRVSTTVRFEPGTETVNTRTKQSLDDLAGFLRRLAVAPQRLRHLVFSQDTGGPDQNLDIADTLGTVFQRELRARNVRVGEVVPLGAIYPLASSDSPLGQWLNRRVETWCVP